MLSQDYAFVDRLLGDPNAREAIRCVVRSFPELIDRLSNEAVHAVLVDVEGWSAQLLAAVLTELSERSVPVPCVVISESMGVRQEVVRLGGRGYLSKSLSPSVMIAEVKRFVSVDATVACRVLVVDDDQVVSLMLKKYLEGAGMSVTVVADPRTTLEQLDRVLPHLVILDWHLPHLDGAELSRLIRAEAMWQDVPMIVLTADDDPATVRAALAAGADDVLKKPPHRELLLVRVRHHLERTRGLVLGWSETESLLPAVSTVEPAIRRQLLMAQRHGQPVSLAFVHFADSMANGGPDRAEYQASASQTRRLLMSRLRRMVRGEDLLARWTSDIYLLVLYGASRRHVSFRLPELLDTCLGQDRGAPLVRWAIGLVEYPRDGTDLDKLFRAAHLALLEAQRDPGRPIVTPGEEMASVPSAVASFDVAIVDDDELLADLVRHALETRRLRAMWFSDGEQAFRALSDPVPSVLPKVILLDVNLPGIDGLSLLRRWQAIGLTKRCRIIVLTVRSLEGDVVKAFELGAFDHVAKPVSLSVLLHRIQRALEL